MEYKKLMHKLITVSILHRYYIHQNASAVGLYAGQPPLLDYLRGNGESSQKDIAAALHVSPASVAVSIKRMEKNGYVSRSADESDARRNRVKITDRGLKALQEFETVCRELDARVFSGMQESEAEIFADMLDKMTENLLEGRDESEIWREIAFQRERRENDD